MDARQMVIDYIEGRLAPKDFEALCDGEHGGEIFDWLQSVVHEGTMWETEETKSWEEIWENVPEEELREKLNKCRNAILAAEHFTFQERFSLCAEMTPLLKRSLEFVKFPGPAMDFILRDYESNLESGPNESNPAVLHMPESMLDMFSREVTVCVNVPYDVRTIYALWDRPPYAAKGSLGYQVNVHDWVSKLVQQHCPEISLSVDRMLNQKFSFYLDVCPDYIGGAQVEESGIIDRIIAEVSENMPKTKRKKLVKDKIKEAFHVTGRSYPRWIQSPEWPMSGGVPMKFVGTVIKCGGEVYEHHFADVKNGERCTVEEAF